jgi:hypothetical protein
MIIRLIHIKIDPSETETAERIWRTQCGTLGHLATRTVDILINGTPIPLARDAQGRRWFVCRGCNRRRQHLYLDELLCRRCARLDYASRHVARSLPNVHRIARWRRQIGLDPRPFAAIPKRKRHCLRYYRIAARIIAEEAKLVGHLRSVNHDLERRIRVRKARGKW